MENEVGSTVNYQFTGVIRGYINEASPLNPKAHKSTKLHICKMYTVNFQWSIVNFWSLS